MRGRGQQALKPELRDLIVEASLSLARLDADRLEELAFSCQALNRDMTPFTTENGADLDRQAREAVGEMGVFGRVLEATRANLEVHNRLRELREGELEYRGGTRVMAGGREHRTVTGCRHGND